MVFEMMSADLIYMQRERQKALDSYYGRGVIAPPPGRVIPDEYKAPEGWHRPVKPTGTGNRHALFTRTPETAKRDKRAWELRVKHGYTYQVIADLMGYSHKQEAHKAVSRWEKDRIASGEALRDSYGGDKWSLSRPMTSRRLPPVDIRTIGIPVRYRGQRACGCYLLPGDRVTLIGRRQHCIPCAMKHHGLTQRDIRQNPALIGKLRIPVAKVP
jgi:hypothetical protein